MRLIAMKLISTTALATIAGLTPCLLLSALLILASPFSTAASAPRSIKVVTDVELVATGYYYNLLHSVFDPHQIALDITYMPYSRAIQQLQKGKADVLLGTYPGFFDASWYSKYPVEIDTVDALISPQLNKQWQGPQSLQGKNIGAAFGYAYDQVFKLNANYREYRNIDSMLKMLASGRIDAILDYRVNILPAKKRLNFGKQFVLKQSIFTMPIYFVFYPSEHGLHHKTIFETEMAKLITNGELKTMITKYLGHEEFYPDYSQFGLPTLQQ